MLELKGDEHIMYGWTYHGGCRDHAVPDEIMVSQISGLYQDGKLVTTHFLYGHKSLSEDMTLDKIVAIGDNENGTLEVNGWGGKYRIVNQELFDKYVEQGLIVFKQ